MLPEPQHNKNVILSAGSNIETDLIKSCVSDYKVIFLAFAADKVIPAAAYRRTQPKPSSAHSMHLGLRRDLDSHGSFLPHHLQSWGSCVLPLPMST